MNYKLSDIYLFSDFDSTIHSAKSGIPEANLLALERFIKAGGNFGLATSRSPSSARAFLDILPINAPCLCLNGGSVYDMHSCETLAEICMPSGTKGYLQEILHDFPELDVAVLTDVDYYYVADPELAACRMKLSNYNYNKHFAQPLEGKWLKTVLMTPNEDAEKYVDILTKRGFDGVRFTSSDTFFIDMLPQESSKGAALLSFCEARGISPKQTVAVGDYYNDIEMFAAAGFSACVADAPQDVKDCVDLVLCSCEDGAVGQLIDVIMEKYKA